eukprot:CAMPEP_0177226788 /NCGR_PEP_ID=MMETSP0367-20130122/40278_1 /TAXON_ID=447022 ORGANISM="Scrippsiella hangoei-like, Strain SHHI-4" /NCGR_SAMPLE_ID=MMETSP0367 /ASSEMBLY_ACC=CAM_ASM_000362 /LENGTH=60 /DNA_ID=CAMNT_0018676995 /DNA_START=1891 /DNA_END=2073 /DNA_ORIENTATION=-
MAAVASQVLPPADGSASMPRWRECWPPSQVTLHADQSPHDPHAQSTGALPGQASVLQPMV